LALKVPENVVFAAKHCEHGYRCLKDDVGCLNKAEFRIPGDGVFIRSQGKATCPYAEPCEGGYACSCPVRIELFEKYGL